MSTLVDVELRECRPLDVEPVLALWRKADAVPRPTDRPDALTRRLERGDGLFLVAVAGDRVVGTNIGGWDGWRGSHYRLAVDPEFRHRGIATALVRETEARLRGLGAERISIRVFHGEAGAVDFWRSVGYEHEPTESIYVKNL